MIGMMGKMNINYRLQHNLTEEVHKFNEWAGEVKPYLTIHNVHIEDYMDESSRSVDAIDIANIQDDYTTEDVNRLHLRFPAISAEDEEEYDEYNEMRRMTLQV
eukprot:2108344-Amphidinium_carterae.1